MIGGTREIRLTSSPRAARDARLFVTRVFAEMGYPKGLVEDAELIATELVTNSLAAAPGRPIGMEIWHAGPCLFLEVWDRSRRPPVCLTPDELSVNGRGLRIVKELSLRFGYATFPEGKVVWVLLGVMEESYLARRPLPRGLSWFRMEGMRSDDGRQS